MSATETKPNKIMTPARSIRFYLILVSLILICLLFPSLSYLFWHKAGQLQDQELTNRINSVKTSLQVRGASLVSTMALSTNQAIASFDFSFINNLIQQAALNDKELEYCLVTNKEGIVVAHSTPELVGSMPTGKLDQQAHLLMTTKFSQSPETSMDTSVVFLSGSAVNAGRDILEVMGPVYNGSRLWGELRCGYSLGALQELIAETESKWQKERNQFSLFFIGFVILFFLLAVLVASLFSKRFLRAIDKLNYGVNAVAEGDLEYRIDQHGLLCREFENLSDMINRMTGNLQNSQNQLNEYSQSLETKVAERTRELETTNKELEAFSYSVSHDLRTPLRAVNGFSTILLNDFHEQLDEEAKEYLQRVKRAAETMGNLIDSLLYLSRTVRTPLNSSTIDLSELAKSICAELQELDPDRHVVFIIEDNITAFADPNLMKIALNNLLANAWKYSSKQESSVIEVGTAIQEDETVYYVKDNGAGFDMQYANKLFVAFQRLHDTNEFAGMGIGLATVLRVINRHGGRIWAKGEVGKGATFYFTLPAAPAIS